MSLLSVVQDVCAAVGVARPASVFSNITTNRTMFEMLALANEMAQRIAYDTRDWTFLKSSNTMTGDGTTTAFDLPADYRRMLLTGNVWRSTNRIVPMSFIPDTDYWLQRRNRGIYSAYGEWTMMGGQLLIAPVMGATITAYYPYLKKNPIQLNAGGLGDTFQDDADTFALGDRILKLGMIWQWKAQKGSPYQEDLSNYGDALTKVMGQDVPMPIIIGKVGVSWAARTAYPFPAPNPPV